MHSPYKNPNKAVKARALLATPLARFMIALTNRIECKRHYVSPKVKS